MDQYKRTNFDYRLSNNEHIHKCINTKKAKTTNRIYGKAEHGNLSQTTQQKPCKTYCTIPKYLKMTIVVEAWKKNTNKAHRNSQWSTREVKGNIF